MVVVGEIISEVWLVVVIVGRDTVVTSEVVVNLSSSSVAGLQRFWSGASSSSEWPNLCHNRQYGGSKRIQGHLEVMIPVVLDTVEHSSTYGAAVNSVSSIELKSRPLELNSRG